jgi:branched-chain amino acid transport system ATP-binding protein
MLVIENLEAGYGNVRVLKGISMEVREGELVCLIGANGAGKSTLLRTISGLIRPTKGSITFRTRRIDAMEAEDIVRLGISHVPEGRRIFPRSTVRVNLEMGAYTRSDHQRVEEDLQSFLHRFPILGQREKHFGGLLSGGEQQMLSICRGLMSRPQLLLLDEPSMGLAPFLVNQVFDVIRELRAQGVTVLLVEQNAKKALEVGDRAYVLDTGRIVLSGAASELLDNDDVRRAYLGERKACARREDGAIRNVEQERGHD